MMLHAKFGNSMLKTTEKLMPVIFILIFLMGLASSWVEGSQTGLLGFGMIMGAFRSFLVAIFICTPLYALVRITLLLEEILQKINSPQVKADQPKQ
ncbi:hypothetical protein ACEUAI_23990 [Aeromonas veronii]